MGFKNYKHISEISKDFDKCKSLKDVNEVIRKIPSHFGLFYASEIKEKNEHYVLITNIYYDSNFEDYMDEMFEIQLA